MEKVIPFSGRHISPNRKKKTHLQNKLLEQFNLLAKEEKDTVMALVDAFLISKGA